jgi:hypothetical protein
MCADRSSQPIVHLVGSIPLPDAETVFRTLSSAVGPHLVRVPDGETGIRRTWIRFLQDVLADNPGIGRARRAIPVRAWTQAIRRPAPALARPITRSCELRRLCRHGDRSWGVFQRCRRPASSAA